MERAYYEERGHVLSFRCLFSVTVSSLLLRFYDLIIGITSRATCHLLIIVSSWLWVWEQYNGWLFSSPHAWSVFFTFYYTYSQQVLERSYTNVCDLWTLRNWFGTVVSELITGCAFINSPSKNKTCFVIISWNNNIVVALSFFYWCLSTVKWGHFLSVLL